MTIETTLGNHLSSTKSRNTGAAVRGAWVESSRVTGLAKPGVACYEHSRVVGTMGRMTVAAVIANGCVLPEKWSALFRVALVAGIVK
ncbi:MAG: hypothetical protein R3268_08520, partial [Acidiferrobacterales bacterium]|nr:hypothetical protein [Acidiferrobacterales bacterium]